MGIREERRAERRQQALDTAMAIIAEDGIDALTMAHVAERMGASVGGLYRYYASKAAILVALQERAIAGLWAHVERHVEALPDPDPRARVVEVFRAYLGHAAARPDEHTLILTFLAAPRPLLSDDDARDINRHILAILEPCAGWLRDLEDLGVLAPGDAMQRVHALWAFVHGLDLFRRRDRILPEPLKTAMLFDAGFDAMLDGWSPARAATS